MFWDNFVRLCNQAGKYPNAVAAEVGVKSSGTVTGWKNGANPRQTVLLKLAEYFGVTVDYLLTGEKEKAPGITAESLTDEEQELISIWRSVMSPEERTKQLAAWKARAGQQ